MRKGLKVWLLPTLLSAVVIIILVTGRALRESAEVDGGGDFSVAFFILLYVNLFLVLALGFIVIRNTSRLWLDRRRRLAGSQLRTRMALLFVALSLLPALIIALLAAGLLNRGVDSWFSERVTHALSQSLDLARVYYEETQRNVRSDALGIVHDRQVVTAVTLAGGQEALVALEEQRRARGLDEVALLRPDGTPISRVGELPFDTLPDLAPIASGEQQALLVTSDTGDRVRAFVRLGKDLYLSTGRWIDPQVLSRMDSIERVYVDYNQLRKARGVLKTTHTVTLILITLLLLLAAVWSGFRLADQMVKPITDLVLGTRQVAAGDFSVTMPVTGEDELATLMAAFNAMTDRLAAQREQLHTTNTLLEERRRFMEAIVNHISSGVVRVDRLGTITLANPAASTPLGRDFREAVGKDYREAMPEPILNPLQKALQTPPSQPDGHTAIQVQFPGPDRSLTFLARITPLSNIQGEYQGFVATFDDLSEVIAAQRANAWSDVARRIAHEIKNPLTPIQLSAQRMRRKYLRLDPCHLPDGSWKVLDECTNTIIRQVEELRVLVNEFSNFARLPRPDLSKHDLNEAVREVLVLHEGEMKGVEVETALAERIPPFPFDRGQIKQVLTNLLANAVSAVAEKEERRGASEGRLAIASSLIDNGRQVLITVADSGIGIAPADRDRVFEPYFTTKRKGTGLGLAIVKKIIEDHRGSIRIRESRWGGVLVEVRIPVQQGGQREA